MTIPVRIGAIAGATLLVALLPAVGAGAATSDPTSTTASAHGAEKGKLKLCVSGSGKYSYKAKGPSSAKGSVAPGNCDTVAVRTGTYALALSQIKDAAPACRGAAKSVYVLAIDAPNGNRTFGKAAGDKRELKIRVAHHRTTKVTLRFGCT